MFSHTKPLSALRVPLTFAALSILLAACGGGNDDGKPAVSASPRASTAGSTSTSGATSTSTATSAAGASTTIAANGSGTSSGSPANSATAAGNAGNASPAGQQDANASGNAPASSANGSSASTANPAGSNAGDATPVGNGAGNGAANSSPAAPAGGSTSPVAPEPRADGATPDLPAGVNATPAGTPADNNTPPAATVPIPAGPVAAISAQGVRGDVLLAMMEQVSCNPHYVNRTETLLGNVMRDGDGTPYVGFDSTLALPEGADPRGISPYTYDYSTLPDGRTYTLAPAYVSDCSNPATRRYTNPLQPGEYSFAMGSARTWIFRPHYPTGFRRGFNAAIATYALKVTDDQVEIGATIGFGATEDLLYTFTGNRQPENANGQTLQTRINGEALVFRRDALVSFGTLREWKDDAGNRVRLMLNQGDTANEGRLCTEFDSALAKRLQCKTWRVPDGWTWGSELTHPRRYIIDDRSVYPNESGHMYWGNVGHYHERAGQG